MNSQIEIPRGPSAGLEFSNPVGGTNDKYSAGIAQSSSSLASQKLPIGARIGKILEEVKEKKKAPYVMDPMSQNMFTTYLDEVANAVLEQAAIIARHRKSDVIESCDINLVLAKKYDIHVPKHDRVLLHKPRLLSAFASGGAGGNTIIQYAARTERVERVSSTGPVGVGTGVVAGTTGGTGSGAGTTQTSGKRSAQDMGSEESGGGGGKVNDKASPASKKRKVSAANLAALNQQQGAVHQNSGGAVRSNSSQIPQGQWQNKGQLQGQNPMMQMQSQRPQSGQPQGQNPMMHMQDQRPQPGRSQQGQNPMMQMQGQRPQPGQPQGQNPMMQMQGQRPQPGQPQGQNPMMQMQGQRPQPGQHQEGLALSGGQQPLLGGMTAQRAPIQGQSNPQQQQQRPAT